MEDKQEKKISKKETPIPSKKGYVPCEPKPCREKPQTTPKKKSK